MLLALINQLVNHSESLKMSHKQVELKYTGASHIYAHVLSSKTLIGHQLKGVYLRVGTVFETTQNRNTTLICPKIHTNMLIHYHSK